VGGVEMQTETSAIEILHNDPAQRLWDVTDEWLHKKLISVMRPFLFVLE
jgi:hypothetical protein